MSANILTALAVILTALAFISAIGLGLALNHILQYKDVRPYCIGNARRNYELAWLCAVVTLVLLAVSVLAVGQLTDFEAIHYIEVTLALASLIISSLTIASQPGSRLNFSRIMGTC